MISKDLFGFIGFYGLHLTTCFSYTETKGLSPDWGLRPIGGKDGSVSDENPEDGHSYGCPRGHDDRKDHAEGHERLDDQVVDEQNEENEHFGAPFVEGYLSTRRVFFLRKTLTPCGVWALQHGESGLLGLLDEAVDVAALRGRFLRFGLGVPELGTAGEDSGSNSS